MPLEIRRETIFVDMQLTSLGRQLASLGRLRYKKVVLADDEVDYSFQSSFYDLSNNFVSSPTDSSITIAPINFDGTPAMTLGPMNVVRGRENDEVEIFDQPFFMSAGTRTAIDVSKCISIGNTATANMDGSTDLFIDNITSIDPQFSGTSKERCVGNLIMIRHHGPTDSTLDHYGEQPFISLWYRINSWDGGDLFTLDRALPNFATASNENIHWFVYPWSGFSSGGTNMTATTAGSFYVSSAEYTGPMINSGVDGPYGYRIYSNDGLSGMSTSMFYNMDHWDFIVSADLKYSSSVGNYSDPSQPLSWSGVSGADPTPTFAGYGGEGRVWNMRIIRTINEIGSTGSTTGYTTYGSTTFNGTRHMFGFNADQRLFGIIYHDNPNIDVDEINRLQLSSTTLFMPTVLWHRKPEFVSGSGTKGGHWFSDKKSLLYYDNFAQLYYSLLRDGFDAQSIVVGRVYHDLSMIVITHQELLNAMSYKSNRNWTLPSLKLSLEAPYGSTTGLCKSDKVYLATYAMRADATYSTGSSFSYRPFIHCGDVQFIEGIDGGPYAISARIENSYFPYLRSANRIGSYSGTGWNANDFNIIIKEVDKTGFTNSNSVSPLGWRRLATGGEYSNQHSETTISTSGLTSYQFTINQTDYDSSPDYSLTSINGDPFERSFSGLSYGDEPFFFGSIEYDLNKNPEKVSIKFQLMPDKFNSTRNATYGYKNECTYVTGIYVMDDLNRVVATAKPSNPVKKDYSRFIEFKLDLIY